METVKRWLSYFEVVNVLAHFDIQAFEIFEALNEGKLIPYNGISGKRYVDEKKLPRQNGIPIIPNGCEIGLFHTKNLIGQVFKRKDVTRYLLNVVRDDDIPVWQEFLETTQANQIASDTKKTTQTPQTEEQAENCFTRNGDFWTIRFQGMESKPIKHVQGLLYIAYLLEKPCKPIHSLELYRLISSNTPDKTIDERTAIDDGLNVGNRKQAINDYKTKTDYLKELEKYKEIKEDYQKEANENNSDAETIMINIETVNGMIKEIQRKLNERNFPGDATKKQSLINGLLKTAYRKIKADNNIKECVVHLTKQIKPDGANGFIYNGEIKWKIFL